MRIRYAVALLTVVVIVANCGGSSVDLPASPSTPVTPTTPSAPTSKAWTLSLATPKQTIYPGDTAQWRATVYDHDGNTLPSEPVTWSSANGSIISVTPNGILTGLGTGTTTVKVAVTNKPEMVISSLINVNPRPAPPPTRPVGSLLRIGNDSVLQYGEYLHVSTLIYADTAPGGVDIKRGVIHAADAPFVAPLAKRDFPQFAAIAECPNKNVYAVTYADGYTGSLIWQIDPATGYMTNAGGSPTGPYTAVGMTCDNTNSLIIVGNFGGFGGLFYVARSGGSGMVNMIDEAYRGVAVSPTGGVYVTTADQYGYVYPPSVERLATVNLSTGNLTQIGTTRATGIVRELTFRGNRLLGVNGTRMVEVSTSNGAISTIRSTTLP